MMRIWTLAILLLSAVGAWAQQARPLTTVATIADLLARKGNVEETVVVLDGGTFADGTGNSVIFQRVPNSTAPTNTTTTLAALPSGRWVVQYLTVGGPSLTVARVESGATNYVNVAPATAFTVAGGTANFGATSGTSREWVQLGHDFRIRQHVPEGGTIARARISVPSLTGLTSLKLSIWRYNGASWDLVGRSDNMVSQLSAGATNTVTFASPITGVKEGDFYGFQALSSGFTVQNFRAQTNGFSSPAPSIYFVDGSTPASTNFAWTSQTLVASNAVVCDLQMAAPVAVFLGDSIAAGHGNNSLVEHYSFIEATDITNPTNAWPYRVASAMGWSYQNLGIGGNKLYDPARASDPFNLGVGDRLQRDVLNLAPRYAVFHIGRNDVTGSTTLAQYTNTWQGILSTLVASNITPVVNLMFSGDDLSAANLPLIDTYNSALASLVSNSFSSTVILAPTKPFVNAYSPAYPGVLTNLYALKQHLKPAGDNIHLSPQGYARLAAATLSVLSRATVEGTLRVRGGITSDSDVDAKEIYGTRVKVESSASNLPSIASKYEESGMGPQNSGVWSLWIGGARQWDWISGNLLAAAHGAVNIGQPGANSPGKIYVRDAFVAPNGTNTVPGFTFQSAQTSGFYNHNGQYVSLTLNGNRRWDFDMSNGDIRAAADGVSRIGLPGADRPSKVYVSQAFVGPPGTNTAPAFSFYGYETNGFYLHGGSSVSLSLNGTRRWDYDIATGDIRAAADGVGKIGRAGADRPDEIHAKNLIRSGAAVTVDGTLTVGGKTVLTPSAVQTLMPASQINVAATSLALVVGSNAPTTLTSTTTIAPGTDGQEVTIVGTHGTNTVTLQDEANLPGSWLDLGGVNRTLGAGDALGLVYSSTVGKWCMRFFSAVSSSGGGTNRFVEQSINSTNSPISVAGASVTTYVFTGAQTNSLPLLYVLPTNSVPLGAILHLVVQGTNVHSHSPLQYYFVDAATSVTNRLYDTNAITLTYTGNRWIRHGTSDWTLEGNDGLFYGWFNGGPAQIPIQGDAPSDSLEYVRKNGAWSVASGGGGGGGTNHNALTGLQGGTTGQYYHLTSAQHTDLTDGGDATSHYHAADRDRSVHTGTQLASTISDFGTNTWVKILSSVARGNGIHLSTNTGANVLTISGNYLPGTNMVFVTNADGSVTVSSTGGGGGGGTNSTSDVMKRVGWIKFDLYTDGGTDPSQAAWSNYLQNVQVGGVATAVNLLGATNLATGRYTGGIDVRVNVAMSGQADTNIIVLAQPVARISTNGAYGVTFVDVVGDALVTTNLPLVVGSHPSVSFSLGASNSPNFHRWTNSYYVSILAPVTVGGGSGGGGSVVTVNGSGSLTNLAPGPDITWSTSGGTTATPLLTDTGVTAGTYEHFTVDAKGRISAAPLPWESSWLWSECFDLTGVDAISRSTLPWGTYVLSSGTFTSMAGQTNHPGIIRYVSATGTLSGGESSFRPSTMMLEQGSECAAIFRPLSANNTNTVRFGWFDNTTPNSALNAVFVELSAGNISGRVNVGSTTPTITASTNAFSQDVFYRAHLIIGPDSNRTAIFRVVESDTGNVVWTNYLGSIPARTVSMGHSFMAFVNGAPGLATNIVDLDWIGMKPGTSRR